MIHSLNLISPPPVLASERERASAHSIHVTAVRNAMRGNEAFRTSAPHPFWRYEATSEGVNSVRKSHKLVEFVIILPGKLAYGFIGKSREISRKTTAMPACDIARLARTGLSRDPQVGKWATMVGRSGTLVTLVERAYEPAESLGRWLDALTDTALCVVPDAIGAASRLVSLEPPCSLEFTARASDAALVDALRDHDQRAKYRHSELVLRGRALGLRRLGADADPDDAYVAAMRRRFDAFGVAEMCHLTACDGRGHCVTVGFMMRQREITGIPERSWTMAAIHLAAAFRLQRRALDLLSGLVADGAVMSPDGRMIDADGLATRPDTRERLRDAVRCLDAARCGRGRERALDVWKGLVDGRWSIVDRHDHDGRRYVIAVPNETGPRDPRNLSKREAQVAALVSEGYSDKWVAYALGLSRTTVSTHLHEAIRKLGLGSRVELARSFVSADSTEPNQASMREGPLPAHELHSRELDDEAVLLHFALGPRTPEGSQAGLELLERLTPAQQRTTLLALDGYSDHAIAQQLGVSRHTVSNHLRHGYRRLGVNSRAELSALVRRGE